MTENSKTLRVVSLTAENVKRIKAVTITPDGDMVVVGGPNDAGKSTVLDAIAMAIGGADQLAAEPIRRGQDSAKIVLDLGDLVVTKTFKQGAKPGLVVAAKDGARYQGPQALLDRLYSSLAFDPLAFERMEPRPQGELLRRIVGLDTTDLDAARQRAYDERTERNRDVKALQANLDALPDFVEAAEVSLAALAARLEEAGKADLYAAKMDREAAMIQVGIESARENIKRAHLRIAEHQAEIASLRMFVGDQERGVADRQTQAAVAELQVSAAKAAIPDTAAIRAALRDGEEANKQAAANRRREEAKGLLEAAKAKARALSERIDGLDRQRTDRIAAVAFPVPGLGLGDDGVTLDGLPFAQASTSDRIRTSVAVGLAEHPSLRVLLVRDGSLLGTEKLKILAEMAKAADCQVWLELLQEAPDARTSVFIEDGTVRPRRKRTQVAEGTWVEE